MRRQEYLGIIDRGERLEDRLHRTRMDAILRFFDEKNACSIRVVRQEGEREQPKCPVRDYPGGHPKAILKLKHEIAMAILLALYRLDGFEIRDRGSYMVNPLA